MAYKFNPFTGTLDLISESDQVYALSYQGTWDASTNTPTISSGVGTINHYYVVSVAGDTEVDGENSWNASDWIVFNGSSWLKINNNPSTSADGGFANSVYLSEQLLDGGGA